MSHEALQSISEKIIPRKNHSQRNLIIIIVLIIF